MGREQVGLNFTLGGICQPWEPLIKARSQSLERRRGLIQKVFSAAFLPLRF